MSLIFVLVFLALWGLYDAVSFFTPKTPAVKNWDAFNRDTIGMNAKEIRKGMQQGKW